VYENIAFPLKIRKYGEGSIKAKVTDFLRLVKLEGLEHRYPRQLSGGQQQRVALARALVFEPPVLLMDEPLGALDKKMREHMQLELKQIQEDLNITVVYVTHDQEEALTMSDRIAVMNEGRIEQLGDRDALYERPANRFIADFIGGANFIEGELCGGSENCLSFRTATNLEIAATVSQGQEREKGKKATLAVRPERIKIGGLETPGGQNVFDGLIEDSIHLTELSKYTIKLESGIVFLVKSPSSGAGVRYRRGDRVKITWDPRDTLVLRD
jgi:ABC-type Fe3+/spermidine/putrescine transport system ATPase subunit